jgi:phosphoribosylformylglycinamidine synthase II
MLWEVDVHLRQAATADLNTAGRDLGLDLSHSHTATGWLIEGELDRSTVERLATELLADPVTETCRVAAVTEAGLLAPPDQSDASSLTGGLVLHVLPKPGVTDPAAESAREAMALLGIEANAVRSLKKYWLPAGITAAQAEELAWKRLASDAIHEIVLGGLTLTSLTGGGRWHLVRETVPLDGLDDAALEAISRERCLALTADELRAVRDHFASLGRPPFEIELETIAQTWSEHCCHKTLGSPIDHQGPDGQARFDNLLKETVFAATQTVRERLGPDDWCVSVFRDNSGVVRFDGDHDICVKVETHNHPSAIEPYGGAATGLGGVIRDVLGTGHGAKPLANLDVFCVAPLDTPPEEIPPGVIPPPRLLDGVVAGVRDYGNRMGIPTIAGAVAFHPGYLGNPLVFCGTVGIMPRDSADGRVEPGDLVVVAGGRTGRDGIHGATFSSIELSSDSETESGGSVQIGHAIHEKTVTDFVLAAAAERLFHAITDCGAGGLSSAVGEMGAELGAEVDLDTVPLKYAGLSATEVWISEAQERMVLAVAPADWPRLAELARQEGTEATAIGRFTGDGRLVLRWEGETVGDLNCHFLHEGRPRRRLNSRYTPPAESELTWSLDQADLGSVLLELLGAADVASKEWIIRQYDHEVQGQSVLKPLLGPAAGPADATVIRGALGRPRGIVLGVGLRHHLGPLDPYQMAVGGIIEAVANCIAAGADPARIALLDNFCWGDCRRPESLGTLVEACLGCQDAAIALAAPFVSGKDSLNNVFTWTAADGQQQERSIPPTLLATALGQIANVGHCISPDLKQPGSRLALIGLSTSDLAGSQLAVLGRVAGGQVPQVDLAGCRRIFETIHRLVTQRLLRACHDLSDGGLAVAVAEMAIGSGLGANLDLAAVPLADTSSPVTANDVVSLLTVATTETPGRFLCEVAEADADAFAAACGDLPWAWLGQVTDDGRLTLTAAEAIVADIPVTALDAAWRAPSLAHAGALC